MISTRKVIIKECETLLFSFFEDHESVWRWLLDENSFLEGKIPLDMILNDEGLKLKVWIRNRLRKSLK